MEADNEQRMEEQLWKSQEDDVEEITADEVRTRALQYERHSLWAYRVLLAITPPLLAAFLYNIARLHEPKLILGQAWALMLLCFLVWRLVRNGPNRLRRAEPCVQYLRRELASKRQAFQWLRWAAVLLLPAIVASWLGGGLILRVRTMGISSPLLVRVLSGNAPYICVALALAFVWFAFTHELRKVEGEIEKLKRQAN